MLNQVIIVGRVASIVNTTTETNTSHTTLTLAVSRSYKNTEGIYETDFIPTQLFNSIATTTLEYIKTGDVVSIKGRIQTQDNHIQIIAEKVTFLSTNPNPQPSTNNINNGEI